MKNLFFLLVCLAAASCGTVDVERKVSDAAAGRPQDVPPELEPGFLPPDVTIVERIVERPVFVPAAEAPPATPAAGADSVRAAYSAGVLRPQDYSHAAIVYDYNPDWVYEVYTQPLRMTDICLQPQERVVDTPFISDSERWIIGAGTSYDDGAPVRHIYIKPESAGLEATLIINTDRRVYRIILKSFSAVHMPIVRWRYGPVLTAGYYHQSASGTSTSRAEAADGADGAPLAQVDPRFLSFNYKITYSLFSKPNWLPELVFDDGAKTYVSFPPQVLQREMPAVFERRRDIVNYRVSGNLIVIDKLVESLTVRMGRREITIVKKKG